MKNEQLVTVITPMYNSEKTIGKTIDSILNQSYKNIELLIIDDLSTDKSVDLVKKYIEKDVRVRLLKLEVKGGASMARNLGIKNANGDFIAFLDSDDTWYTEKLEKQIKFMQDNDFAFTYTNYDVIKDGEYSHTSKIVDKYTYKELLKVNRIGCLTVVYDRRKIKNLEIPKLDKRNDYALWLKALRSGHDAYLLDETLSTYYESDKSLSRSSGKLNLLKYHYQLFTKVLGYGSFISLILTCRNAAYNVIPRKRRK